MKRMFIDKTFRASSLDLIAQANELLELYTGQGYRLSLRQLYYQLVARVIIPNTVQSYKRLGKVIGDARLAGLVDWAHLEDRERPVRYPAHWDSPGDFFSLRRGRFPP